MDTFDEMMKGVKMKHEPSPDFTDRVMEEIENMSQKKGLGSKLTYGLLAIAASVIIAVFSLTMFGLSDNGSSDSYKEVSINTLTTTTAPPYDVERDALADEFDSAITSLDKDSSTDISSNGVDASELTDS